MEHNQDKRVKRTQQLLAEALISLTLEKGYDSITIRDITERAEVGYATFFRHYSDKDALLKDVLEVVLEELLKLLSPSLKSEKQPSIVGTLIFDYVQTHQAIVRVLLSSHVLNTLVERVVEVGTSSILEDFQSKPNSPIPPEIAAYHIVTATLNLVQWWLDHQMPYSAEKLGLIYQELIVQPTKQVAFEINVK